MEELIELLDKTEKYDKENALIDIYIYLLENGKDLNEAQKVFMILTKLRDRTLADGSDSFFEEYDENEMPIHTIKKYVSDGIYELFDKEFDKIDRWIVENEWSYNDELSDIIKQSIK